MSSLRHIAVLMFSLCSLVSSSKLDERAVAAVTKTVTVSQCTSTVTMCKPKPTKACKSPKVMIDNFDNYTVAILPLLTPIGTTGGLSYNGFNAVESEGLGLGVTPHSGNNTAAAALTNDLLDFGTVTLNPFGTITTAGTTTSSFELTQFYFACGQNTIQAVTTVPIACQIAVFGYTTSGKQVGLATYSYVAPDLTLDPMLKVYLPTRFRTQLLTNVTFALTDAVVNSGVSVLFLDDVKHNNCA